MTTEKRSLRVFLLVATVLLWLSAGPALAKVNGITGTSFQLRTGTAHIQASDGASLFIWGFANGAGPVQYPGPTLIVNQGDVITVSLTNTLNVPVSIVFPGQEGVIAAGGVPGLITNEAPAGGGTVSYTFTAAGAGTYMYHSGTRPEVQIDMGLVGAIIVRPVGFDINTNRIVYNHPDTWYDWEYLFLMTEMDNRLHELVELGQLAAYDDTTWFPYYWFFNGRNAPDTMIAAFSPDLPHQPYDCMPRTHPGERVLVRIVSAGRKMHPLHLHGNSAFVVGKDGRLVARTPATGPDLATLFFTVPAFPGETYDTLWDPWTGKELGWDIYGDPAANGHTCTPDSSGHDPVTSEWCADHGVPVPVVLPHENDLTYGAWYSGSPHLGEMGALPPGNPGFNVFGGISYMWHSHDEKELTTNDIFPGGMFTMMMVEPHGVSIDR
jgi:hypothetical protein